MKLRQKTLLIVSMTLVGLMAVIYTASSAILASNIKKAEENEAKQTVKGILSLLVQTQENFKDRFSDWSAWDDTYTFIQDGNKNYIRSNLVPQALTALKINLMLHINNSGQIVYGTGFDLKSQTYQPVPKQLSDRLSNNFTNDLLIQRPKESSKRSGIIVLPSGPMWITSQPILTSEGTGPLRGTLIVGRNLDREAIAQLSRLARLSIAIYPIDSTEMPADFQSMRSLSLLEKQGRILVKPLDENMIGGYTIINDIYGDPSLILRIKIPRTTYQQSQKSLRYLIVSLLISGIAFAIVVLLLLEKSILSRVAHLINGISSIRHQSDLSLRLSIFGSKKDEISDLTKTINKMLAALENSQKNLKDTLNQLAGANKEISSLNERLKADNLRMSAELAITRQLQQMILPKESELSLITELDIAGFMEPADEVGGDYYDVLTYNGRVKIGIGDVTGHGLESGVLMIMLQTAVRSLLASNETDPVKFLVAVNRTIYDNIQRMNSDKSLSLSLLDYAEGSLRLSGQHEEIIVIREGGKIERIDTADLGFPIGLEADIADFVTYTDLQLNSGDAVVLYTDGITEAQNTKRVAYGVAQLCDIVSRHWQSSASEIRQAVIDDVRKHIGEEKVYDDLTLLIFKKK